MDKLRTAEAVRQEERSRSEKWLEDLREGYQREKQALQEKVEALEAEKRSRERDTASEETDSDGSESRVTPPVTEAPVLTSTSTTTPTPEVTTTVVSTTTPLTTVATAAKDTTSSTSTGTTPPTSVTSSTSSGTTPSTVGTAPTIVVTATRTTPTAVVTTSDPVTGDTTTMLSRFIEAHSLMLSAHAQAMTLPPLPMYEGQTTGSDDDAFEKWLQRFEERAKLARWDETVKLCQLKLHLTKTAEQVLRSLTSEQKDSYSNVVSALKARFRPIGIEELKGWEFHRRLQGDESVEQLGMDIQKLGRKDFPTLTGHEFDRLLKGRFYQALITKWQCKLGAPHPDETFLQLFERARAVEHHDKQYSEASNRRDERKARQNSSKQKFRDAAESGKSTGASARSTSSDSDGKTHELRTCHICHQPGHFARRCPDASRQRTDKRKAGFEAPGRATDTSRNSCLEADPPVSYADASISELEALLAQHRLEAETTLMLESGEAQVGCVSTEAETTCKAVGPSMFLDVSVEGVSLPALVDCGAQSTIISRELLHRIARKRLHEEKKILKLEKPIVRLFGKDGPQGGRELIITAQVELTIEACGKQATVPVFVQPKSSQDLLLGSNACLALGLKFLDSEGEPLKTDPSSESRATVRLIQTTTVPAIGARFVRAKVTGTFNAGGQLLFEPEVNGLCSMGVSTVDSLLTCNESGEVRLPVCNFGEARVVLPESTMLGHLRCVPNVEKPDLPY